MSERHITDEQAGIIGREIGKAIAEAAVTEFQRMRLNGVIAGWLDRFGRAIGEGIKR